MRIPSSRGALALAGGRRRNQHVLDAAASSSSSAAAAPSTSSSAAAPSSTSTSSSSSASPRAPRWWLLKSEPDTHMLQPASPAHPPVDVSYSFARLAAEGVGPFFGVRNFQARTFLRDGLAVGDRVLFYHSGCKVPGVAGLAEVARAGYPDPDALDAASPFYDAAHTAAAPRWFRVDLRFTRHLQAFVPLPALRADAALAASGMVLLRQPRLSVQPVTEAQAGRVLALAAELGAAAAAAAGGAGGSARAGAAAAGGGTKRGREGVGKGEGEGREGVAAGGRGKKARG